MGCAESLRIVAKAQQIQVGTRQVIVIQPNPGQQETICRLQKLELFGTWTLDFTSGQKPKRWHGLEVSSSMSR